MSRRNLKRVVVFPVLLLLAVVIMTIRGGRNVSGTVTLPQPEVRQSFLGILSTTLEAKIATNMVNSSVVTGPTYEGTIPGPTLRVRPGDTLFIKLPNSLPLNPSPARMGAFPHDPNTTNLHTHGLTVSPRFISDNVLREMEPETKNLAQVTIPRDHPTGTFWYHPHKHGSVAHQMFGGMAGFLIVQGGRGTLDNVPEVKAAREVLMAFQVIRTDTNDQVPFVNTAATNFMTLWSTLDGGNAYVTTNGAINPTLYMKPGEVVRLRLLAAGSGELFPVALEGHALNIIAHDGITIPNMRTLPMGTPYVLGTGQRVDVLVKASTTPGTYLLKALAPSSADSVISGSGIGPQPTRPQLGPNFDSGPPVYPVTLATIEITNDPLVTMGLPSVLPVPKGLPSISTMLGATPDKVRHVAFEICGAARMPVPCPAYFTRYDTVYWGGTAFENLLLMLDADDGGLLKEGLFTHDMPLFDMKARHIEEWTVSNRSPSDHTFHIHQNPFLVTHINGTALSSPFIEWHDVITVPKIVGTTVGSVTFRTYLNPVTKGSFVMHCHMLQHEDVGMMQRLDIRR